MILEAIGAFLGAQLVLNITCVPHHGFQRSDCGFKHRNTEKYIGDVYMAHCPYLLLSLCASEKEMSFPVHGYGPLPNAR